MSKTSADVAPFHYLKAVFAMRDTISSLVRSKFIFYSKARWSKRWRQCYSTSTYHHHPHHHHSLFSVCFLHMQGEQVFKSYFQAFMHLGSSLTFQSSIPLLITSLCFSVSCSGQSTTNLDFSAFAKPGTLFVLY